MNDIEFFNNFAFNEFTYHGIRHTDNSHGVGSHFLAYMKRGRGEIFTSDFTLKVTVGDIFYIPKGLKYRSTWIGENEGKGFVSFDSIGFLYFPTKSGSGYKLQKVDYNEEIFNMYRPLRDSKQVNAASIGTLYALLGKIEPILEKSSADRPSDIVQTVIQLMEKDHTKSIPEYARMCDVSESLLYLYFKEIKKKTPNDIRQQIACKKAINLLTTSALSVEEICDRLSFSSSSYFRKILYKETGKTPREIRQEYKSL